MTSSESILNIYKSRNTLIEILQQREFNVDDYNEFSINEINVMFNNNQLDLLLENNNNKIFVKYYLGKSLRPNNIINYPNLSIVNKLQPKLFYRDPSMSTVQAGFIAQDLQEITDLSFLVYSNYHNYKKEREKLFVNYDGIQPYLIASLQEIYFILEKMAEHNDFSYTYNYT